MKHARFSWKRALSFAKTLGARFARGAWGLLKHNLGLKIIAVIFAVILWSYVLFTANPVRNKTIANIPVQFSNYELIKSRDLAIAQDISYGAVTAKIVVQANNDKLSYISADNVSITAELSQITAEGEYRLVLTGTSQYGSVVRVSPAYIDVDVEALVTKTVDVEYAVPEADSGMWRGSVSVSPETLTIAGAQSQIDAIDHALVTLSTEAVAESVSAQLSPQFVDIDGKAVNTSSVSGASAVVLTTQYLPAREVTVALTGSATAAAGYHVSDTQITPSVVTIAAPASLIDSIADVATEALALTDLTDDASLHLALATPDGVAWMSSTTALVEVTVDEDEASVTFGGHAVRAVLGSPDLADARFDGGVAGYADVTLTGPRSVVAALSADDIDLYADTTDAAEGDAVPLQWRWLISDAALNGVAVSLPEAVSVTANAAP